MALHLLVGGAGGGDRKEQCYFLERPAEDQKCIFRIPVVRVKELGAKYFDGNEEGRKVLLSLPEASRSLLGNESWPDRPQSR